MKMITLPLAVLVFLSLLSMTGLGDTTLGSLSVNPFGITPDSVLYDISGTPCCYANGTSIYNDGGQITDVEGVSGVAFWYNSTGTYDLFVDSAQVNRVRLIDTAAPLGGGSWSWTGSVTGSLGTLMLILGMMALSIIVGARILGTGVSEESVSMIIKGSAFLALWGAFSVLSLGVIVFAGDSPLMYIYFVLTIIYTLGIINQVGHPGDD